MQVLSGGLIGSMGLVVVCCFVSSGFGWFWCVFECGLYCVWFDLLWVLRLVGCFVLIVTLVWVGFVCLVTVGVALRRL